MYKHILIPTDGSALSESAVKQGMALAKALQAKVTSMTASVTYHTFTLDPFMVADTAEQCQKDCEARAPKYLGFIEQTAKGAGVPLRRRARHRRSSLRGDHRYGQDQGV